MVGGKDEGTKKEVVHRAENKWNGLKMVWL